MRPGFYNDNAARHYPLVSAPHELQTPDGDPVLLPKSVFVDFGAIMGMDAGYVAGSHRIYLRKICRFGDRFLFEFRSDAPGTFGTSLFFSRELSDDINQTEYQDSQNWDQDECSLDSESSAQSSTPSSSSSSSDGCPDEPLWSGFLICGDLSELAELMASGAVLIGSDDIRIEPALIRDLAMGHVRSINLANDDRTRVDAPDGCDEIVFPFPTGQTYVRARCLTGALQLIAGHNTVLTQDQFDNSITVSAEVGAGEGEPCEQVALFAGEAPPDGRTLLDGALGCNEVLRSINGIGGQFFDIIGGQGVAVTSDPETNTVSIDISMINLAICAPSESSASSEG